MFPFSKNYSFKLFLNIVFSLIFQVSLAQQINIPVVDLMPDLPQPYEMRDWKNVAQNYDSLVFKLDATGQHMPLSNIFENTSNYPEHPGLAIQSYVGTNSPPGKEAINVIPAVIGASLSGINKSNQNGHNWPLYCEEYFNRRPEENVYLNGPTSGSGNDWWYETMPNIFFYQLNYLYPGTGDFDHQFTSVADQWLRAVYAMEGNTTPWEQPYMNYRAFRLSTMTPRYTGVKQPEAAGAIAWILYQAFVETGDHEYRIGAELAMEFLNDWGDNPSYEIQLPYGAYAAARMNAELGTQYDLEKIVNWCFDRGDLRGWGVINGDWNGMDMDGLIGEVNAFQPDYVFHMNSLEHVGALVPMTRYDDRFATAIAKWVLNAANASRFYYSEFLPDDMQDNKDWISQYDPKGAIAYESLREKEDGPFGTGDAMGGGWAETNLGLYGSSHVGIFGGIIEKTNIEGILKLDLLATDYYRDEAFSTYLYYNPHGDSRQVDIHLEGSFDIYDAISNTYIGQNVSGTFPMMIMPGTSIMAVVLPANSEIYYQYNQALVNGIVIDYNAQQLVLNYPPRIKALTAGDTVAIAGGEINLYCTAEDLETAVLAYEWTAEGSPLTGGEILTLDVPATPGTYEIICTVTDEGDLTASDTLLLKVVEKINYPPVIEDIIAFPQILGFGEQADVECIASDANNDELTYTWSAIEGTISGSGNQVVYTAPDDHATVYLVCEVSDVDMATTIDSVLILSRDPESGQTGDLVARYEFDGDAHDVTQNGHDGVISNSIFTEDMHGMDHSAINYNQTSSKVVVDNDEALNFRDGLTICYWINITEYYDRESYPVSHGNWTTRWKTSLTDERLRFTINGTEGIIDVDSDMKLETGEWYHIAGIYNGEESMVFVNGRLAGFKPFSGQINTTPYDLVFGQSLLDQTGFNYTGSMDKLRLYNYGISYESLITIYELELSDIIDHTQNQQIILYPNPAKDYVTIEADVPPGETVLISIVSPDGKKMKSLHVQSGSSGIIREQLNLSAIEPGIYFIDIKTGSWNVSGKIVVLN